MIELWKNLIYLRGFHLVWFNVLVKKLLVFSLLLRREGEERSSLEWGRKLTSDLDFTNVCWRKKISAFTVLFDFKVTFGSRWSVEVPEESRWVWYCFVFLFEKTRDVNERETSSNITISLMKSRVQRPVEGVNSRRSHDLVA